jgi:hypothetical protein
MLKYTWLLLQGLSSGQWKNKLVHLCFSWITSLCSEDQRLDAFFFLALVLVFFFFLKKPLAKGKKKTIGFERD